jgi:hypothetical protein
MNDKWFQDLDGVPFLRAVAVWPALPAQREFPYVYLNMDFCCERMDRGHQLANLLKTFQRPKRCHPEIGERDEERERKHGENSKRQRKC